MKMNEICSIRISKMKNIGRMKWMGLIAEFMKTKGFDIWDWDMVLKHEGGYGESKIKTLDEALKYPNTFAMPARWFQSDQKDLGCYSEPGYVYSALFGKEISQYTFSAMKFHFPMQVVTRAAEEFIDRKPQKKIQFIDWGGTIFTSYSILKMYDNLEQLAGVHLVNVKSPQTDFAAFAREKIGVDEGTLVKNISIHFETEDFAWLRQMTSEYRVFVVLSEILEHMNHPEKLVKDLMDAGVTDFYIANSFCTIAYGHYIPITIGGKEYSTTRHANKAFKEEMTKLGLEYSKVEGFNSHCFYGKVK